MIELDQNAVLDFGIRGMFDLDFAPLYRANFPVNFKLLLTVNLYQEIKKLVYTPIGVLSNHLR